MKRTTFTKVLPHAAARRARTPVRTGYPGYVFTHGDHPGVTLIVCRGSKNDLSSPLGYSLTSQWVVFDPVSGHRVLRSIYSETRARVVDKLSSWMSTNSPDAVCTERLRQKVHYAKDMLSD